MVKMRFEHPTACDILALEQLILSNDKGLLVNTFAYKKCSHMHTKTCTDVKRHDYRS